MEEKKKWVILTGMELILAVILFVVSCVCASPHEGQWTAFTMFYVNLIFPAGILVSGEAMQFYELVRRDKEKCYRKRSSTVLLVWLIYMTVVYFYSVWPTQKFFFVFLLYSVGVEIYKMKNADRLYLKE